MAKNIGLKMFYGLPTIYTLQSAIYTVVYTTMLKIINENLNYTKRYLL